MDLLFWDDPPLGSGFYLLKRPVFNISIPHFLSRVELTVFILFINDFFLPSCSTLSENDPVPSFDHSRIFLGIHWVTKMIFLLSILWIGTCLPKLDLLCNFPLFLYGYENWDLWILQCNQLSIDISVVSKDIIKIFFYPIKNNVFVTLEVCSMSLKSKHGSVFFGWSTSWLKFLPSHKRILQRLPHFLPRVKFDVVDLFITDYPWHLKMYSLYCSTPLRVMFF